VLDIEISFKAMEKGKKQDRIDILLYDTKNCILKFVEAKHFTNTEIWSKSKPKVIKQLERYEKQIATKEKEIINAYTKYIAAINEIFKLKIQPPQKVEKKVSLLIFGFDQNQKEGRLTELILKKPEYKGLIVYAIGGVGGIKLKALWDRKPLK
jgi:predicted component of viral defense system (DUF524 family)